MKEPYHVRVDGEKERKEAITFLEKKGFENIQNLTAENYQFPILIVEGNCFFGTNTTYMACICSVEGNKILAFKELQAILRA